MLEMTRKIGFWSSGDLRSHRRRQAQARAESDAHRLRAAMEHIQIIRERQGTGYERARGGILTTAGDTGICSAELHGMNASSVNIGSWSSGAGQLVDTESRPLSRQGHMARPCLRMGNYRAASPYLNSKKAGRTVLDPFEIRGEWFEVLWPSLQLAVTAAVPRAKRDLAEYTIRALGLRDSEWMIRWRQSMVEASWNDGLRWMICAYGHRSWRRWWSATGSRRGGRARPAVE